MGNGALLLFLVGWLHGPSVDWVRVVLCGPAFIHACGCTRTHIFEDEEDVGGSITAMYCIVTMYVDRHLILLT